MVRLPDRHTVRFVWGYPPHAEDVDTAPESAPPRRWSPTLTRRVARTSPVTASVSSTPVTLRTTAPTPSSSTDPDGREAVAEVPIAEPSRTSDPVWLPDGQSFLYDIDDKHVGVFSLQTKRSEVVPTTTAPSFTSVPRGRWQPDRRRLHPANGGLGRRRFSFPASTRPSTSICRCRRWMSSHRAKTLTTSRRCMARGARWRSSSQPRIEDALWEEIRRADAALPAVSRPGIPPSSSFGRIGQLGPSVRRRRGPHSRGLRYHLGLEVRPEESSRLK